MEGLCGAGGSDRQSAREEEGIFQDQGIIHISEPDPHYRGKTKEAYTSDPVGNRVTDKAKHASE